ncbi:MAG: hypothetical protein HY982_00745 [Candidatus Magasanikbacteria bacterium]|nr:hypothetical protein [Candidatus Magasanikbacteria bacterium]
MAFILIDITEEGKLRFISPSGGKGNYKCGRGCLLFFLDKFLKSKGLSWAKIRRLVLLEGRGSFSRVREAAALLNVISLIRKIPIFGLDARRYGSEDEIFKAAEKLPLSRTSRFLKPIYSGEPNITFPKDKNHVRLS